MKKELQVANYLVNAYERITDTRFEYSELMLQKLMYFAQKTSLALTGKPLFHENFEGWIHGPVLKSLRGYFDTASPVVEEDALSETDKYIIENTIHSYGQFSAWKLRDITHEEYSWKKSMEGLSNSEYGFETILIDDIRKDAEKVHVFDHQFDMYIDEFDDAEEEFRCIG